MALTEFKDLCLNKMVLVATNSTKVVACINKGMRLESLYALLCKFLNWCSRKQVTFKAQHIPGRLNVVADKLSRLGQAIQTESSLLPEVFWFICNRWHQPRVDLFVTRFNYNSAYHRNLSNLNLHALAPRASVIKDQGFSEAVTARIEAPQRGSARSVRSSKNDPVCFIKAF